MIFSTGVPGTEGRNMSRKMLFSRINASEWDPETYIYGGEGGDDDSAAPRAVHALTGLAWGLAAMAACVLGTGSL